MLETLRKRVLASTRQIGLLGWTLSLATLPAFAGTESLPAGVRGCAAETDPARRLACYDKEVARFPEASPKPAIQHQPPAADCCTQSPAIPVAAPKSTKQDSTAPDPRHLSAHVVSIDHSPNEMVLHLDNGQVWQQTQAASGDLSLRAGDAVKIDKQLGTYWLSGPHGVTLKVRQKT